MPEVPANAVLTVSALTGFIRETLEDAFPEVWVQGEISNFRRQESGHCYFSLKDEGAQLPCVLFRGNAAHLAQPLRDGMKVNAFGRISVYAPRGSYQLVCQFVLPAGQGSLAERFEALKRKLADEGLFDAEKKLPLPVLPRRIAIITSPTGAVLRDFLSILSRRGFRGRVVLFPAKVQGPGAAEEIAKMVRLAGHSGLFDLVVLARGGGSLEDLWPFNEELVARAVAACPVPTLSGVGHETDFSLCDFAASKRAETPSAAAELISSLRMDAEQRFDAACDGLEGALRAHLDDFSHRLELAKARLAAAGPQSRVKHLQTRLDGLSARLSGAASLRLSEKRRTLDSLGAKSAAAGPEKRLLLLRERLDQFALRVESASPASVVRRGYAIVRGRDGGILESAGKALERGAIVLEMRDGRLDAEAKAIRP